MAEDSCSTDPDVKMTPVEVRESIVKCFYEAHRDMILKNSSMSDEEKSKFTETSIREIVRGQFIEAGGDFENPTKESLFFAIIGLAEIAKQFRDIDRIVGNFLKILKMIDRL